MEEDYTARVEISLLCSFDRGRDAIGAIHAYARQLEIHGVYTKFRKSREARGTSPTARVTVDTLWPAGSQLYRYTACNYDRI